MHVHDTRRYRTRVLFRRFEAELVQEPGYAPGMSLTLAVRAVLRAWPSLVRHMAIGPHGLVGMGRPAVGAVTIGQVLGIRAFWRPRR